MRLNGLNRLGCGRVWIADTAAVALVAALFSANTPTAWGQTPAPGPAFNWIEAVDNSGLAYPFVALGADAQGNTYIAGSTRSPNFPVLSAVQNHLASPGSYDVFVTKLDPSGNAVYSTYFGGSADDVARAVTVDGAGNIYVAGTTGSRDFPTTPGSWSPTMPTGPNPILAPGSAFEGGIFVFKLTPNGSLAYSTYFTSSFSPTLPQGIAVDAAGAVYLTGITYGGVPATSGAYQTNCACMPFGPPGFLPPISDTFAAKFDAAGSKLIYSTYLNVAHSAGNAIAAGADGSAYVAGPTGVYRLDAAGSSLLASIGHVVSATAMIVAPDGRVYVAGQAGTGANQFQATAGAFQSSSAASALLPGQGIDPPIGVAVLDASLHNTLAATYFGQYGGIIANTLALDSSGNVYLGGGAKVGILPTRAPLQEGFGGSLETGFVSELSGDLSHLLFSSYFGDGDFFSVSGLAVASSGAIVLGGATDHGADWVNSVQPASPALRIDAVENAASLLDKPVAAGETIVVRGTGFAADTQLLVGGVAVPTIAVTANAITAAVPSNVVGSQVTVQVQSGGAVSNQVLLAVRATAPGLFSADGSGFGQGYIMNQDGSMNTPANPARPGDKVTIYATGVGPVSFTNGYAMSQFPADAYIDGFHCDGLAAVMGPVAGLPGAVYQLTVYVPNPATMVAANPNLLNFQFPPQVGVVLQMDQASSQNGLAISIAQ